jgi:transposase
MMAIHLVGIDLAKNIFQLHGIDSCGKVLLKKRVTRDQLAETIAHIPKCTIAMEACGGSNYWARVFQRNGHGIKLISPQFVKPFVQTNKNDANDAQAIAEAASRPSMRFVPIKQISQQDIEVRPESWSKTPESLVRAKHNQFPHTFYPYSV